MSEDTKNGEENFNDAELQDIMNEIESLEKEFVDEEATQQDSVEVSASSNDDEEDYETVASQQNDDEDLEEISASSSEEDSSEEEGSAFSAEELSAIEAEIEAEANATNEEVDEEPEMVEAEMEEETSDNVVTLRHTSSESHQQTHTHSHNTGAGHMHFSGSGEMDMTLTFEVAGQEATVKVGTGAINVNLHGVNLTIDENGCNVHMDGGVQFTVPLTGTKSSGKNAA